jgi:hypothetical protein
LFACQMPLKSGVPAAVLFTFTPPVCPAVGVIVSVSITLVAATSAIPANRLASCVVLKHRPTNLSVKCQRERSQALNRFLAKRQLLDLIEAKVRGEHAHKRHQAEKIRRQKRRRSRRAKEKMLEGKKRHAEKKGWRRPLRDFQ